MLRLVAAVDADKAAPAAFVAKVREQADQLARLLLDETRRRDAEAKAGAKGPRTKRENGSDAGSDAPAPSASTRAAS